MGWFSSDRTIREYADDIWKIPLHGTLPAALQEPGVQRGTTR
jgi:glycogen phosphorylase